MVSQLTHIRGLSRNSIRRLPANHPGCPPRPEPVYHPGHHHPILPKHTSPLGLSFSFPPSAFYPPGHHHPILRKHTWPVGVGCSFPASVFCPFCPALRCGYRTRCVTEHPDNRRL